MVQTPLSHQLIDDVSAFTRKLRASFNALVKERGLTLPRARVIFNLSKQDGLNQKELADLLELETPTLVRILDAMEAQGFVERRTGEADRRSKYIFMAPVGRAIAGEIDGVANGLRLQIIDGIDPADLEVTLSVIRRMTANLQAAANPQPAARD